MLGAFVDVPTLTVVTTLILLNNGLSLLYPVIWSGSPLVGALCFLLLNTRYWARLLIGAVYFGLMTAVYWVVMSGFCCS